MDKSWYLKSSNNSSRLLRGEIVKVYLLHSFVKVLKLLRSP